MEREIGDYRVLEEIARGGMGVVVRAESSSGETVAIKLIHKGRQAPVKQLERFRREAEALTQLRHPNLVTLREVGEHQGAPFIVMDLVEGQTLETRLVQGGPLPIPRAIELTLELARVLEFVHQAGLIHRDVKPDNVLLDKDGKPHLTDFGLVKDLDPAITKISLTGAYMGTPGFWPPEQAKGTLEELGPAADVYALGATLYAMLTGGPPFDAESVPALIRAAAAEEPDSPLRKRPETPPRLAELCLRCLAKAPDRRPTTAKLIGELEAIHATPAAAARPAPAWALPASVATLAACVVVALLVVLRGERPVEEPPPSTTGEVGATVDPVADPVVDPASPADRLAELARLDQILEKQGLDTDSLQARAALRAQLGDTVGAADDLGRILEFELSELGEGDLLTSLLQQCERTLSLVPNHVLGLTVRGCARLEAGDTQGALADLERARGQAPAAFDHALYALGEPWGPQARNALAHAARSSSSEAAEIPWGELTPALLAHLAARSAGPEPQAARSSFLAGLHRAAKGSAWPQIRGRLQRAVELAPDSTRLRLEQIKLTVGRGRAVEARELLAKATRSGIRDPLLELYSAEVAWWLGDVGRAAMSLRSLAAGKGLAARCADAELAVLESDFEKARDQAQRALAIDPTQGTALLVRELASCVLGQDHDGHAVYDLQGLCDQRIRLFVVLEPLAGRGVPLVDLLKQAREAEQTNAPRLLHVQQLAVQLVLDMRSPMAALLRPTVLGNLSPMDTPYYRLLVARHHSRARSAKNALAAWRDFLEVAPSFGVPQADRALLTEGFPQSARLERLWSD